MTHIRPNSNLLRMYSPYQNEHPNLITKANRPNFCKSFRQYFKAAYYYLDEPHRTLPCTDGKNTPNWEDEPGPDGTHSGAISVEIFPEHVAKLHEDSDFGFSKEYEEIQRYCSKTLKTSHEHSSHIDNKCKNRYLNIVAYDHSRVKLLPVVGQKKTSDYINANYIDGFQKCNAYIGTQGPLEDTREAFWRMVWEQNVYVIVMITNLMERGRVSESDQYISAPEKNYREKGTPKKGFL